jgi:hypothetical protein
MGMAETRTFTTSTGIVQKGQQAKSRPAEDPVCLSIQFMLTSRVMLALVSAPPFSQFPLHIRCFTEYAHAFLTASPSPHDVILDLGGVSGSTGRESTLGATSRPIDVSDNEFRSTHWDKWCEIRESQLECGVCRAKVDPSVCDQYSEC